MDLYPSRLHCLLSPTFEKYSKQLLTKPSEPSQDEALASTKTKKEKKAAIKAKRT